jgi:hypothetical protein
MKRFMAAALLVALILVGDRASAQADSFSVDVDRVVENTPGSVNELTTVDVDPAFVGLECTVTATARNNQSVHENSDLLITSGTASIVVADVERGPEAVSVGGGTLVLGATLTVEVQLGVDGVFSGGVDLSVDCPAQPEPTPTPEPTPVTTVTPTPEAPSTPEVTPEPTATPPVGVLGIVETPTPPAPVGGISTGAGGTANSDNTTTWSLMIVGLTATLVGGGMVAIRKR